MERKRFSGSAMAAARKAAGLNQAELAEVVGRNRVTISDIERGKLQPGKALAAEIAGRLDVELASLYEAPGGRDAAAEMALSAQERQVVEAMRRVGVVGRAQIWAFAQGLVSGAGGEGAHAAADLAEAMEATTQAARAADSAESRTGSA